MKRQLKTSWVLSDIKIDGRETEREDLVVIHLIQWGNGQRKLYRLIE